MQRIEKAAQKSSKNSEKSKVLKFLKVFLPFSASFCRSELK